MAVHGATPRALLPGALQRAMPMHVHSTPPVQAAREQQVQQVPELRAAKTAEQQTTAMWNVTNKLTMLLIKLIFITITITRTCNAL